MPFHRSIDPVLQAETAECGLACLSMLLHWHGRPIPLRQLRAEHPAADAGVNLQKLMRIAQQQELAPRAVRLELDELTELALPCILHWDYSHYVVLEKVGPRRCQIIDPALGKRRITRIELSQHFTGIALELSPTLQFSNSARAPQLGLRNFIPSGKDLSIYLGKIVALSLVLQGFALFSPYYIQTVVDDVLTRGDADFLLVLAIGFALISVLEVLLNALRSWIGTLFGQQLSFLMGASLLERLLRLPLNWFATRQTGDIASRFASFEALRGFLTQGVAFSLIDGAMAICFVGVMWLYAPTLTLVVLISVAAYLCLRLAMFTPQREANAEHLVAGAKQSGIFLESIKHMNSLKSYGSERTRGQMWEKAYSYEVNTALRLAKLNLTFGQTQALLFGLENILVIYLGASSIIEASTQPEDALSIGMLYAFIAYKNQFKDRIAGLVNYLVEYRLLRVHLDRLSDIALADAEVLTISEPVEMTGGNDCLLRVAGLGFAYPDKPPLFQDVRMTLQAGESIAIGGPSGCGKSTLLRIIAGLTPAQHGEVWLQGHKQATTPLPVWRALTASVTQEDGLLAGSIADNVTMFAATTDPTKLAAVGELTGLLAMVERLPLKWETRLGELGIALSAGQQQRVLLARALYAEPELLILDEATAHLDEAAEAAIFAALQERGIAFVVVSHRVSIHDLADHSMLLSATNEAIAEQPLASPPLASPPLASSTT